ncbi:uncharacterized protein LOC110977310 isoform X2 [Acanthaster planci]|uniref:Uncharacterized protein LOC110977310 isoform X2 n=1 Tax=Acanthaster planci TaxID=133434 RepID=A0A8B7Y3U3_ACAPL|nr:uncharacterized protein LOC110977310 isoform X2 [Acanthaster planci]
MGRPPSGGEDVGPHSSGDLSTSRDALATEVPSTVSTKPKSSELNHCYTQTVQFIRMNDYLKDSQERLADQATELQRLGQAIKEQVESLRTQLS